MPPLSYSLNQYLKFLQSNLKPVGEYRLYAEDATRYVTITGRKTLFVRIF